MIRQSIMITTHCILVSYALILPNNWIFGACSWCSICGKKL